MFVWNRLFDRYTAARNPHQSPTLTPSVRRDKSSLVIVSRHPESHHHALIVDSHSVCPHTSGMIKFEVSAGMQQRSVWMVELIEPLKENVIRIVEVHGQRVRRAGDVNRLVALAVPNRR